MRAHLKNPIMWKWTAIVAAAGLVLVLVMDMLVMPAYTRHGQGVTVPDVTKLSLEDAGRSLEAIGLRYEVYDQRPNENVPPDHVIDQTPAGGSVVKPNRKIYLMVSAESRPTVRVPDLVTQSLDNARIQLQTRGLAVGRITYESSPFRNAVLRQSIAADAAVRRGVAVDLVIGDGVGQRRVAMPMLVGLRITDAQLRLRDAGLRVGNISYQSSDRMAPNHVLSFDPIVGDSTFEGTTINLVIAETPGLREEIETGVVLEGERRDSIPPRYR